MNATNDIDWGWDRLRQAAISRWGAAVLLGNLGDAMSTLTFLQMHLAHEMNPLMRWAYQVSPLSFMAAKLGLVHLALMLLCLNRHAPAARLGEAAGGLMYMGIMGWHFLCWSGYVGT